MADGILYEPRSLWAALKFGTDQTDPTNTSFLRRRFLNGSRFKININRIALCPVGYALANAGADVVPTAIFRFQNSMSILALSQIRLNAPFRKHYSRQTIALNGFRPRDTWMPAPLNSPNITSSLWGISRLDFDRELRMPAEGTIQFQMTSTPYQPIDNDFWGTANPQLVKTSMAFHQAGGQMNAATRYNPVRVLDPIFPTNFNAFGFPLTDQFLKTAAITNINNWPASGIFSNRLFDQQNPSRSGAASIGGFSVHIDQIAYDTQLATASAALGVGAYSQAAPLSTCTGCRMKTVSGGSGEAWWADGAPLALVLDTITPAIVVPLEEPITLPPGQTLDFELYYPPTDSTRSHDQMVGVSLNGYAVIEE